MGTKARDRVLPTRSDATSEMLWKMRANGIEH